MEWIILPFGLTCSPRVLTKVLKPIIAFLRLTWCIALSIYMDDMLLRATSPEEAVFHAQLVMLTLLSLGVSFNFKKMFSYSISEGSTSWICYRYSIDDNIMS